MRIFCDTNIILEFLQKRTYCELVEIVISYAIESKHKLFISFGSFYTITYLVEKYIKQESLSKQDRLKKLRSILNGVLDTFELAKQTPFCLKNGVNDSIFDDLEDSYQAHIAEDSGCNVILTINEKHFSKFAEKSALEIITPQGFVEKYINN